ncbi:uncharacterized protein PAC_20173 [Phialocephala subalpina]|uniref:MYND-type domain-containing protein n=1 Tax=Phialocephala subalpina TaxID=576137 RepID=A0A1L7XYY4_9HELO|nr:uncharacterized protein PAC_20173 [Phialocephala subalpina]
MSSLKCAICDAETSLICSVCKSASYCSTECQKKDLPLHKLLCDKLEKFKATHPRPKPTFTSSHKLALRFPASRKEPEFIWVKINLINEHGKWRLNSDIAEHLHGKVGLVDLSCTQFVHPHYGIDISYDDEAIADSQCIAYLLDGCESVFDRLPRSNLASIASASCGSYVVTRWVKTAADNRPLKEYQDITLNDVRESFAFFYRDVDCIEIKKPNPFVLLKQPQWVSRVIISCRGEELFQGKRKYRQVAIRHEKEKWYGMISSISKDLGFPLGLEPYYAAWHEEAWRDQKLAAKHGDPFSNPEALNLMLGINPMKGSETSWNSAEIRFTITGKLLTMVAVGRIDQQDITEKQIEVLSRYCTDIVHVAMQDKDNDFDEDTKKAILQKYLCKDRFNAYFDEYKAKKLAEGDASWADAYPPKPSTPVKEDAKEEDERLAKRRKVMRDIESRLGEKQNK